MTSGVSFRPQDAPSAAVYYSAVLTLEDAKSNVADYESEYLFVCGLNLALLHKADETRSYRICHVLFT
jgi:hypothetical protein